MFILKRNITGYSPPVRDYEKRCKVTNYLSDNQIITLFYLQIDFFCLLMKPTGLLNNK